MLYSVGFYVEVVQPSITFLYYDNKSKIFYCSPSLPFPLSLPLSLSLLPLLPNRATFRLYQRMLNVYADSALIDMIQGHRQHQFFFIQTNHYQRNFTVCKLKCGRSKRFAYSKLISHRRSSGRR